MDDSFDLAAVDVEFAGYRPLPAARLVPGPHRLLQARLIRLHLARDRHRIDRENDRDRLERGVLPVPDHRHQQLEGPSQRQPGPGAWEMSPIARVEQLQPVGMYCVDVGARSVYRFVYTSFAAVEAVRHLG